uniref:Uncharacterized protein n=1 Tax=Rhizophora mucronata TaxID=61149 RepID=A0A2P2QN78_RHIMU
MYWLGFIPNQGGITQASKIVHYFLTQSQWNKNTSSGTENQGIRLNH